MEVATANGFDGIHPRWFLEAATKQSDPKVLKNVTQYFLKVALELYLVTKKFIECKESQRS